MITPVWALTIDKLCERKNDLLFTEADIKELARNERAKAIDEFAKQIFYYCSMSNMNATMIRQIAEQLKGGAT